MKIRLNGQEKDISSTTLDGIINEFCKDVRHVIAEVNGDIVKSSRWSEQTINEGDEVELVNIVGGG